MSILLTRGEGKGAQGRGLLTVRCGVPQDQFKQIISLLLSVLLELPLCKAHDLLNRKSSLKKRSQAPFETNPKLQSCIVAFCCQSGTKQKHLKSLKKTSAAEWIIHAMKISEMPVLDRKLHAFAGLIFLQNFSARHSFHFVFLPPEYRRRES